MQNHRILKNYFHFYDTCQFWHGSFIDPACIGFKNLVPSWRVSKASHIALSVFNVKSSDTHSLQEEINMFLAFFFSSSVQLALGLFYAMPSTTSCGLNLPLVTASQTSMSTDWIWTFMLLSNSHNFRRKKMVLYCTPPSALSSPYRLFR